MSIVMGVMIVFMVAGFFGFGMHHSMMGGRGKEEQKQEKVLHEHDKEMLCPEVDGQADCPSHAMPEKENKGYSSEEK
ncbi:MAG: hypothetical protein HZB80_07125 [Deltaproteobacteria bacterium]|nr:hypothetical protein [Deltaproteobacteria bacterium]